MLEIPEVRARISPVEVAQYHLFPEFNANGRRTELIRGAIIEKKRKSPLHAHIARRLYDCLHETVPKGFSVRQHDPSPFTIPNRNPISRSFGAQCKTSVNIIRTPPRW